MTDDNDAASRRTTDEQTDEPTTATFEGDDAWQHARRFVSSTSVADRVRRVDLGVAPAPDTESNPPAESAERVRIVNTARAEPPALTDGATTENGEGSDATIAPDTATETATAPDTAAADGEDTEATTEASRGEYRKPTRPDDPKSDAALEALADAEYADEYLPGESLTQMDDRDAYEGEQNTVTLPATKAHVALTCANQWPGLTSGEYADRTGVTRGTISSGFTELKDAGFTYVDTNEWPRTHYLTEAGEKALDIYGLANVSGCPAPVPKPDSEVHRALTAVAAEPGITAPGMVEAGVTDTDGKASAKLSDLRKRHLVEYTNTRPPYEAEVTPAGERVLDFLGPYDDAANDALDELFNGEGESDEGLDGIFEGDDDDA